jgi:hypothetical protein
MVDVLIHEDGLEQIIGSPSYGFLAFHENIIKCPSFKPLSLLLTVLKYHGTVDESIEAASNNRKREFPDWVDDLPDKGHVDYVGVDERTNWLLPIFGM